MTVFKKLLKGIFGILLLIAISTFGINMYLKHDKQAWNNYDDDEIFINYGKHMLVLIPREEQSNSLTSIVILANPQLSP